MLILEIALGIVAGKILLDLLQDPKAFMSLLGVCAVGAALFFGSVAGYGWYQNWKIDRYTQRHYTLVRHVIANHSHLAPSDNFCADPDYRELTQDERQEAVYAIIQAISGVDYTKLAAQAGAISSTPFPAPTCSGTSQQ